MTFGEAMAKERRRRGMTQIELSIAAGVEEYTIQRWEHGHHRPRTGHITALAAALGACIVFTPGGDVVFLDAKQATAEREVA